MSGNEALELVTERGWKRGLGNMLRSGLDRWFRTKTWWIHCLIWGGIVTVIVSSVAFNPQAPALDDLLMIAFVFIGLFPAVGVIIVMQDAIVGEKQEGTAAWILSKPVARPAFVLSKLIANSIGVLLTMTIVPIVLAYIVISIAQKSTLPVFGFIEAGLIVFINLLFFLSLTLMLGTLFSNRAAVIGISLAVLFLQQNIINFVPLLRFILPWNLILPVGTTNPFVFYLLNESPVPLEQLYILLVILVEIVLFNLVGLWRFNRDEF